MPAQTVSDDVGGSSLRVSVKDWNEIDGQSRKTEGFMEQGSCRRITLMRIDLIL